MSEENVEPVMEVTFPIVSGSLISSLHGYSLYSAVKKILPWMGDCPLTLISSIDGIKNDKGLIETQEFSRLRIRTPVAQASRFYSLAGQTLSVGQGRIFLKVPTIGPLSPKATLQARIVIIHLSKERELVPPDRFLVAATRQLSENGINGRISLLLKKGALKRQVLLVKNRKIPGYGVEVSGLSEDDSLKLQTLGLGGKKKMGAGYFR